MVTFAYGAAVTMSFISCHGKFSMHRLTTLALVVASAFLLAACGSAPKRQGPPPEFFIFSDCTKEANLEGFSTIRQRVSVTNGVAAPFGFDSFALGEREMTDAEKEAVRQCYDAKVASGAATAPAP